MNKYELLLFDADGTLFDYNQAESWSLERTLEDTSIDSGDAVKDTYRKINHALWAAFERGEVTIAEIRVERFRKLLWEVSSTADPAATGELYLSYLGKSGFLIDGTVELLDALYGKIPMAIITNGITETQYGRLETSGIGKYFDPIIISGEVGSQKPDPAIFETLFAKANFHNKEKALIIGDSLTSDMQGGVKFGIDTCWYNPEGKPRNPDIPVTYEIRELSELLQIIGWE
ncbi:MAG: noncanonical pyrimidine nucleotidase, YjjG family [Bacteroidetes bacterium]|nr:noncanonical pyrimidine nucleotidase, YjjG family [Bacteroidota bacterium]